MVICFRPSCCLVAYTHSSHMVVCFRPSFCIEAYTLPIYSILFPPQQLLSSIYTFLIYGIFFSPSSCVVAYTYFPLYGRLFPPQQLLSSMYTISLICFSLPSTLLCRHTDMASSCRPICFSLQDGRVDSGGACRMQGWAAPSSKGRACSPPH